MTRWRRRKSKNESNQPILSIWHGSLFENHNWKNDWNFSTCQHVNVINLTFTCVFLVWDSQVCVENSKGVNICLSAVDYVAVLIGSSPNLTYVQPEISRHLPIKAGQPLDAKRNPIAIDQYTHESVYQPGLYALGPLAGDNYVRYIPGGAVAVAKSLFDIWFSWRRRTKPFDCDAFFNFFLFTSHRICRNKRPPRNKRSPKTVIFQRGEYTKPMAFDGWFFKGGST